MAPRFKAACHCGHVSQEVEFRHIEDLVKGSHGKQRDLLGVKLCHCTVCRHATGLLSGTSLHFCPRCGSHVFRQRPGTARPNKDRMPEWDVATGVVDATVGKVYAQEHVHVSTTKDGGISTWLKVHDQDLMPRKQIRPPGCTGENLDQISTVLQGVMSLVTPLSSDILQASCACQAVCFYITRPDVSSKQLHSPFPDLMFPYFKKDPLIPNIKGAHWWLQGDNTKYLAGTCACRSCRLTSGFEIQPWAFIPRTNIHLHIPLSKDESGPKIIPLDFARIPGATLQSYPSSPGVLREFCGVCGATIFWHNEERPDLVDVSVGLFFAEDGVRAESWLEWWTERVSFAEHAKRDWSAENLAGDADGSEPQSLIENLELGLATWAAQKPH